MTLLKVSVIIYPHKDGQQCGHYQLHNNNIDQQGSLCIGSVCQPEVLATGNTPQTATARSWLYRVSAGICQMKISAVYPTQALLTTGIVPILLYYEYFRFKSFQASSPAIYRQ